MTNIKINKSKHQIRVRKRLAKFSIIKKRDYKIIKKTNTNVLKSKQEVIKSYNLYHKSLLLYISITVYIVFIVSIYVYYN